MSRPCPACGADATVEVSDGAWACAEHAALLRGAQPGSHDGQSHGGDKP